MFFRCCALACIIGFSIVARAQMMPHPVPISGQLDGQVRYGQGGRPAEFVLVRLESFGGGIIGEAMTDRNGKFRFTNLSGQLYVISVRVAGFQESRQEVDLRTQLTDYVQLQLIPDPSKSVSSSPPKSIGVVDASIPKDAAAEFEKGSAALLKANNLAEGIAHLEKAVAIYPRYSAALLLLGTAYMDEHRWKDAEETLIKVLTIEPKAATAHLVLGELYLDQKKYDESKKELSIVIGLDPKSSRGHLMLGRVYYELGDFVKAGPEVGTALRIDPALAQGHLLAGNILLRAHQPENALIEFEEYLRLEPKGEYSEQARELAQKIRKTLSAKSTNP